MQRPFRFDERVAEVFDDMLDRSVPGYRDVIGITGELLASVLEPEDVVADLGCSTGTTLLYLSERLQNLALRFMGIDTSESMIEKSRRKAVAYSCPHIQFAVGDLRSPKLPQPLGAVLIQYTLQFLDPADRLPAMIKIRKAMRSGGILVLSEKIRFSDDDTNDLFVDIYHRFKERQGYSKMEISRKRDALENVLNPWTSEENEALLRDAGFTQPVPFFQWFNFKSWFARVP